MLEAELRHQAFHDTLTGLANRSLFSNRVEHSLLASKRDGSTIAVLYCDLNGLKRVNDSLGYAAGDDALLVVADRLRSSVRGQDTVARMGGNEFAILLDRLTSPNDATLAMERVMALLRQPIQLPGAQIEFQPHIGIAVTIGAEETAENLLRNAAVAMHQARRYEGSYALFDPEMHASAIRRIEVESELRTALDEKQFVMYYQPTIDLQTGRLTGVEALVRWNHPRRGIVAPMEFIPLAEESGLIIPLGQWAIQESCRQIRIWQKEIPANEPIALNVNLSARQLRHPNIVRDIADALDDSGLLPSRLILEITESVLMVDTSATISRLVQLKSLGVRLAIDDFGTGYSSFAYLRRFPVDIIKIDKSFVDGVATEPTASALVDAMIRIGKTLQLETVAEGVELVEQADRLRTLKCDIGQGYLFSRPLPSDAISAFLQERSASGQEATAA
jgi:diguanylate cyclase (GGDEF)-like protein